MSVDTVADALLSFRIFFLSQLSTGKGAVEYPRSITDLYVGIAVEDILYWFAVCVHVLAPHRPPLVNHPRQDI